MTAVDRRARKTIVTGASGFIGVNLVSALAIAGRDVLALSRSRRFSDQPNVRCAQIDVGNQEQLVAIFRDFVPDEVVHLAAATGFLTREDRAGFEANVNGTRNVLKSASETPTVTRCIFASSHTVALARVAERVRKLGRVPYLYEDSKLASELLVHTDTSYSESWCIVRPCSAWGPGFGRPFRELFTAIARGRYFHPGKADTPKRLSFVGNLCHQILRLLDCTADAVHQRTFFLADYETITLRDWANLIADRLGVRRPRTMSDSLIRVGAIAGDALQCVGYRNPPLSSFRLSNIRSDSSHVPIQDIQAVTGALPYSTTAGVDLTVNWLRLNGMVK